MNLTEKAVEKLKAAEKRQHVYDDLTGFGVRVEEVKLGGRKSFFWYAKVGGKICFRSLGEPPSVTVAEARAAARTLIGIAAKWKSDGYPEPSPFAKVKRSEPATATVPSFSQLVEAYVRDQVGPHANRPNDAEYDVRWRVKRHFSTWADRPVDSITVEDVLAVKNECGEHHTLANRAVQFIRTLYNWSAKSRNGRINFWPVKNPAVSVEFFNEEPRTRFLQPEEMLRFEETLDKETNRDLKDFIVLSLESGARSSDVRSMRWADIFWEQKKWSIPQPKNDPYPVFFEPLAMAVLERRRKETPASATFVFPGRGKSGHMEDPKKAWKLFLKKADVADVRIHDVRRTVGSYMAVAGESLQKIAAVLGHKSVQSTLVYARLQDQAIRESKAKGQAKMRELMAEAAKRREKLAAPQVKRLAGGRG